MNSAGHTCPVTCLNMQMHTDTRATYRVAMDCISAHMGMFYDST